MQAIDKKVISHLNQVLKHELTAINQYFLHAKMFKDWGLKRIASHEEHESIDEMKHSEKIMERILFLDGLPKLQNLNKLRSGETVPEMLQSDLEMEMKGHIDLKSAISDCEQVNDYVSRDLLEEILESEEEHIDWLETQLSLIEKIGSQNYLRTLNGLDCDSIEREIINLFKT